MSRVCALLAPPSKEAVHCKFILYASVAPPKRVDALSGVSSQLQPPHRVWPISYLPPSQTPLRSPQDFNRKGTIMLARTIAFMVICSATLLMMLFPAAVHAQVTVDITKITCRQYLIGNIVPTKSMAIWFSGYYSGKRGATMIEMSAVEPNADKVELYCGLHQDEMLMKAIEDVFGVK
jgi:acid stress chaperone HdeB